jgi:hypothetical protein
VLYDEEIENFLAVDLSGKFIDLQVGENVLLFSSRNEMYSGGAMLLAFRA